MVVTKEQLRVEIGAVGQTAIADETLQNCVTVAGELVRQHTQSDEIRHVIPTSVYEKAWLSVAVELYNQRAAPNGVLNQQFSTVNAPSSVPIRIGADPLRPAYPLLAPWVPPLGFA